MLVRPFPQKFQEQSGQLIVHFQSFQRELIRTFFCDIPLLTSILMTPILEKSPLLRLSIRCCLDSQQNEKINNDGKTQKAVPDKNFLESSLGVYYRTNESSMYNNERISDDKDTLSILYQKERSCYHLRHGLINKTSGSPFKVLEALQYK